MSVDNVRSFYNEMLQNSHLLTLLSERTQGKTKNEALEKLVELAEENGYAFTLEDFHKFHAAKLKALEEGELDDSDLELVAGGKGNSSSTSSTSDSSCFTNDFLGITDPLCLQCLSAIFPPDASPSVSASQANALANSVL